MFLALSKRQGFTLVEMVITLVILGVISAVALPKFFNQGTFDERYFHDDLLSATRYAQRLATGSGCRVRLSVSASGFFLDQDSNCSANSPSYSLSVIRPADSDSFSNTDIPSGLILSTTHPVYYFLPQGAVVDSANNSIGNASMTLVGITSRTIAIVGATGYAYSN